MSVTWSGSGGLRLGAAASGLARLLAKVARRRVDLAPADALVLDVGPDRLAAEAGLPHKVALPAMGAPGGYPYLVERRSSSVPPSRAMKSQAARSAMVFDFG